MSPAREVRVSLALTSTHCQIEPSHTMYSPEAQFRSAKVSVSSKYGVRSIIESGLSPFDSVKVLPSRLSSWSSVPVPVPVPVPVSVSVATLARSTTAEPPSSRVTINSVPTSVAEIDWSSDPANPLRSTVFPLTIVSVLPSRFNVCSSSPSR